MPSPSHSPAPDSLDRATRNLVVLVICTGSFLSPLTMAAVNVAIPSLADALRADAESVALIPTLFLLSSVALMLPFARLADNYGRKRVYALGLATNAAASLACWFADSIEIILLLRLVQGAGSAMVFGTGLAIITAVFPPRSRGLPMGLNTAAVYIGLTVSPALGGWVTDSFSWREVFLLPVPPMLLVVLLIALFLRPEWRSDTRVAFDWRGAVMFAGWACALVFGLTQLPRTSAALALLASCALLVLFVRHQAKHPSPLIRIGLLRENRMFSRSLATASLMYGATYPLAFLLSLYLQYLRGLSALEAGQVMLLQTMAMAVLAPFAGRLSDSLEPRVLSTAGCLLCAVGFALLSQLDFDTSTVYIGASLFLLGIGFGFFSTPNNNAVMSSVGPNDLGMASASVSLARTSGNLIGISAVNLLVHLLLGDNPITEQWYEPLLQLITAALAGSAVITAIAALCSASRGPMRAPAAT